MSFPVTKSVLSLFLHSPKSQGDYKGNVKEKVLTVTTSVLVNLESVILPSQVSFRTLTGCSLELFPNSSQQIHTQLSSHAITYMEIVASQLHTILYWTTKRACNMNCNVTLLMFCWVHLCFRDWFTFVPFCDRGTVEISKAQSGGMEREEQKEIWKKISHLSIKIHWSWIETTFLKTKLALPRISHVEWKQQSGKSSLKLNIKLKISKRVLLKLLLYKGFWNSVLRSFNTSTVCRFLKAIR